MPAPELFLATTAMNVTLYQEEDSHKFDGVATPGLVRPDDPTLALAWW
jgi:hypothetical protein